MGDEPMVVKVVQLSVPEQVTVVVATLDTPAPPLLIKSWPLERAEVVAIPQYAIVAFEPPTSEPKVPMVLKGPVTASEVVATEAKVVRPPTLLMYVSWETAMSEVVAMS